ncbi:MAG: Rid family hydrolase [Chloroflexota bacterium]
MSRKRYFKTEHDAGDHRVIRYLEFRGELCTRQIEVSRGRWRFAWQSPDLRNPLLADVPLSTLALAEANAVTRQAFDDAWATAQARGRHTLIADVPWEHSACCAQAVRVGRTVMVAGTSATDDQWQVVGLDDAYAQTVFILQRIERALHQVGAAPEDIVRTRVFVTDTASLPDVVRAHAEFFADIRPVTTLAVVQSLIMPGLLVTIEADALIASAD